MLTQSSDETGVMVWPATYSMIRFLLMHRKYFSKKKILELGSGAGVTGLWALLLGNNVTLTDFSEDTINLLEYNIEQSKFTESTVNLL